jgi:hypothetical protein
VSETRRQALKMLGAVGVTCAFPFEGDELYGQHVHVTLAQTPTGPYAPTFFTPTEYTILSRLTDVIIPPTDTPGASAAGVPEYIDRVVSLNKEHQPLIRAGLAWLERHAKARYSRDFLSLSEDESAAILQPLSDTIDRERREAQQKRFRSDPRGKRVYYVALTDKDVATPQAAATRPPDDDEMAVRFFRLVKNLTADGYYTSRVGLLDELGYVGNRALAQFQSCSVPEH